MEKLDVEFTDRYGGHPPPHLRSCFGPCEAMGFYPENDPAIIAAAGQEPDDTGWAFLKCPDCHGSGRVSRWVSLARLPRHMARGARSLIRPGGPEDAPWWWTRWFTLKWYSVEAVRWIPKGG